MSLTREKFQQGMTTQQYIDQVKVNKQPFIDIHEAVEVPEAVQKQFDGLSSPLNLAVFTADWCGDAMSTTPSILRLAESTDGLVVNVFNRDEELELSNTFLPEERAGTVPIFVVCDSDMNEVARFVETAHELVPDIDAMDGNIDKELEGLAEGYARRLRRGKRTEYRVSHANQWGAVILQSFADTVARGLTLSDDQRPAVGGTKWPSED
jgi:thiol-disulfide isomerase/thioredoxin|tara:strand:+ start:1166 stop:1792 length:627 start_codon:yes stop_codon:yes gene_type:complete